MSDSLTERLRSDLNTARRERDKPRTLLLSTTLSEVKNREIELGRAATDEDVTEMVMRAIKRRRESAEMFRSGDRAALAEKEEQEAAILTGYLPTQMTEEEARAIVRGAVADGAASIGAVMAAVMPQLKGRFDGRQTNRIVREELG